MIRVISIVIVATGLSTSLSADERPLMCFGTEPFWGVDLTESGAAQFSTPDGDGELFQGSLTAIKHLDETLWRGTSAGGEELVVWMQNEACSDNMSDMEHPVTARVSLPGGEFLAGCCRVVSSAAGGVTLEGSAWRLKEIDGATPAGLAELTRPVTVTFQEGRVQGFSGCNNFTGSYSRGESSLRLNPSAGTMMACPEPASAVESSFQQAFSGLMDFRIEDKHLKMIGDSGNSLLFEHVPPPQLAGSRWKVTGFNNGRQAVVGVIDSADLTLQFGAEEVSGSAGCNRFSATYTTEGDRISFGPATTSRMACEEPVMAQEQQFLSALTAAVKWRIDGNTLDMHREDSERAILAVSE